MDIVTVIVLLVVAVATLALGLSFVREGAGRLVSFFLSGLAAGFGLPLLVVFNSDPMLNVWVGVGLIIAVVAMANILRISRASGSEWKEDDEKEETKEEA